MAAADPAAFATRQSLGPGTPGSEPGILLQLMPQAGFADRMLHALDKYRAMAVARTQANKPSGRQTDRSL